ARRLGPHRWRRGPGLRPRTGPAGRRFPRRPVGRGLRCRIHFLWPRHPRLADPLIRPAMSLTVSNLCKDYPTRSGPLPVLSDVNFDLPTGSALAVMGPSGSGKSTLLHILGTLDSPTSGAVRLDGKDPFALSEAGLADFRNRHIGFVFQDHYLLPQCS